MFFSRKVIKEVPKGGKWAKMKQSTETAPHKVPCLQCISKWKINLKGTQKRKWTNGKKNEAKWNNVTPSSSLTLLCVFCLYQSVLSSSLYLSSIWSIWSFMVFLMLHAYKCLSCWQTQQYKLLRHFVEVEVKQPEWDSNLRHLLNKTSMITTVLLSHLWFSLVFLATESYWFSWIILVVLMSFCGLSFLLSPLDL